MGSYEIDEPTLLAAAAPAGQPATSEQLERWRRAGLVPRPRTEHPLGLRGSRAWYPDWAIEQLIAVASRHRSIRRLKDLTVVVWWEGHWVEHRALRGALVTVLERVSTTMQYARAGHDDPYDAADAILQRPQSGPRSPIVGLISRRLGQPADVKSLLWTLLALGLGGDAVWEDEDWSAPDSARGAVELFAVAGGMHRAMTENLAAGGPWSPPDFEMRGFLEELRWAGAFDLEDIARQQSRPPAADRWRRSARGAPVELERETRSRPCGSRSPCLAAQPTQLLSPARPRRGQWRRQATTLGL